MLKKLLSVLTASAEPEDASLAGEELRVAYAALLIDLAMSDHVYADSEAQAISRVLSATYGLDEAAAKALRVAGERAQAAAVDSHRFTSIIKASTTPEERIGYLEGLWAVALADGGRESEENNLMRRLTGLLQIPDRDSALARQRVEARG
ncbi:MAG: TerB family tellurite resistance protein [Neomegalonema sp.]|nr:TerB family tellurite resistance protein [Neomegalonema sp.]